MPHCIIEYSNSIESIVDVPALIKSVYQGVLASSLFTPEDIKCRAISYAHCYSGKSALGKDLLRNNSSDFIHVEIKILQGRDEQQKADLSRHVLTVLETLPFTEISLTVEVVDIAVSSYQKVMRS